MADTRTFNEIPTAKTAMDTDDIVAIWDTTEAKNKKVTNANLYKSTGEINIQAGNNENIVNTVQGTGFYTVSTPLAANIFSIADTRDKSDSNDISIGHIDAFEVGTFGVGANRLYDDDLLGWGNSIIAGQSGGVDPEYSPNLMFYTIADLYPVFDIKAYDHGNIRLLWDAYTLDSTNWKSSNAASFQCYKDTGGYLRYQGAVTAGAGETITWKDALVLNANGYGYLNSGINAQTGTTYTIQASDNGKIILLYNASAITVTVPQESTETIPDGFSCKIIQTGAGQVTVVKEGSDNLLSADSLVKLRTTNSEATVAMVGDYADDGTYTWTLSGDLSA